MGDRQLRGNFGRIELASGCPFRAISLLVAFDDDEAKSGTQRVTSAENALNIIHLCREDLPSVICAEMVGLDISLDIE